ncbi:hypothetical protein GDO81_010761 [Engystomops pustulosus]|uniref:Nucleoside diphosphate kinase homolog 5 n=1 Tax=Engystomops pustulosus TaxID=76066 RepID=A0AAV7C2R5_ENGPU|nr:hypothetical protein GDO81_010761 [Engystomops pustulosus]
MSLTLSCSSRLCEEGGEDFYLQRTLIRAIYGTDELRNAVHGSYCLTSAEREIPFMFPQAPIEPTSTGEVALDYLDLFVNPALISGLFHLCKEKPSDPYLWLADWLLKHNTNRPEVCDKAN